jgi:hypothetical protein
MTVVFIYLSYAAINLYDTPRIDSLSQMVDNQGHIQDLPASNEKHPLVRNSYAVLPKGAIPALNDLPLGLVNEVMFGDDRP